MSICAKCHREAPDGALFCSFCGATIRPPTAEGEAVDPLIGQTVSGKYFVHQLLGRGGMGEVYKATHLTLDRPVVLKLLKKSFLNDPSIVQRFHREARAASRLNHPNSITIIDFGQADDGTLFMAMEYLSGRSLARVIAEDQPIPEARVVHIGAQILAALAEAHALGIIHRDLKPENVMLESRRDEADFVKVLDFGIAKLNEPGDGAGRLTQAGIVCGTPGYMSPEQVRGDELDARSDLYSVGIILYEMLTGKLPFDSETPMGLVTKHLVEAPPALSARKPGLHVSPGLEGLVLRCLAKDRNERPASAEEMRAALLAWAAQGDAVARRPTPPPPRTLMIDAAAVPEAPRDTGSVKVWRPPTGSGTVMASQGRGAGATQAGPPTPAGSRAQPRPPTPPPQPTPPGGGTVVMAPPPPTPAPARSPLKPTPPPTTVMPTPAPSRPARPVSRTPPPVARPPRHEADEEEEAAPVAAPGARSKLPLIAGGAAAAVVVIALVVWGLAGGKKTEPAPEPPAKPAQAQAQKPAPPAPAPVPLPPAPEGTQLKTPEPVPPPQAQAEPEPEPKPRPPPKARKPAGKGIRAERPDLNSIPTPPASSEDGVLTVTANPWAYVYVDGARYGETPREFRLGVGTYKIRGEHPTLGRSKEETVTVQAGKRRLVTLNFAN